MTRLSNKISVITGGARGMGAATARLFAREGATVIIADLPTSGAAAVAAELGEAAAFYPLDVSNEAQWESMTMALLSRYGRIDALVNNAGIVHFSAIDELTERDFDRVFGVNVKGPLFGIKHVG